MAIQCPHCGMTMPNLITVTDKPSSAAKCPFCGGSVPGGAVLPVGSSEEGERLMREVAIAQLAVATAGGMRCDVCAKAESAYLLSTSETITNPKYWEFVFRNHLTPKGRIDLGTNGEKLGSHVLANAADASGWALCESCIQMYLVDRSKARHDFQTWQRTGKQPPYVGIALIEPTLDAAKLGWKRVFGTEPRLDREQDPMADAAMAKYAMAEARQEKQRKKKWWRL